MIDQGFLGIFFGYPDVGNGKHELNLTSIVFNWVEATKFCFLGELKWCVNVFLKLIFLP